MTQPSAASSINVDTIAEPVEHQAWSLAEDAPEAPVRASEGIKEAVAAQSETAGTFVQSLDDFALTLGQTRISAWDVLIVLMIIMAVLIGAAILSRLAKSTIRRITKLDEAQHLLAEKIAAIVVWGAAVFIGIDLLGIDLTALAVFSGAFGLAIGFGLQKTFGNLIAGIILLIDKSIKPGDVIAVADTVGNETFGQIRKIGVRAVSITTRDQREYLIPNENLMINQVENWSYSSKNVRMQVPRRCQLRSQFGQGRGTDAGSRRTMFACAQGPPANGLDDRIWRQFGKLRHPLLDSGPRGWRRQRPFRSLEGVVDAVQGARHRDTLPAT